MNRQLRSCLTCPVMVVLPEVYCESCKFKHNADNDSCQVNTVVVKPADIPLEYTCSRCKKDLRDTAKKNKCDCKKSHPFSGNKSGDKITSLDLKYDGYSYKK